MSDGPTTSLVVTDGDWHAVDDLQVLAGRGVPIDTQLISAVTRAWSANTLRAFRADLALWKDWCRRHRIEPRVAEPTHVASWIRMLAGTEASDERVRAAATIERYLVHVGKAYRLAGLTDPTASELVRLECKAARTARRIRQRQAHPIRYKGEISDLDSPPAGLSLLALLKACRRDAMGYRDAALLRIAYDTGMRRSELVSIRVDEIEKPDADGSALLFIPVSKTDRVGEGALAYLSPATMAAIAKWRKAGQIDRGPLFRRVITHFDGSIDRIGSVALHPNSVPLILKRLVRIAHSKGLLGEMSETQLDRIVAGVSGHSIRVGVAQDNFAAGESLPAIMQAYRWRDAKTVLRYGAKLAAKSGASARLAKRFEDM